MLKIKEMFPNLLNKKIEEMQKVINSSKNKSKSKINITTKSPSRKQVIVLINTDLTKKFIKDLSLYVIIINHALKAIKSNTIVNFICVEENLLISDADQVLLPRLPQSKSYLKIVGIPYISEKTNSRILLDNIKNVLKNNHPFNDIVFTSKPQIIKVSPKSNMTIIWIDIWDIQNGSNAKKVINRWFNIGSFIAIVHETNMNPDIPQYKNCWKWRHIAGVVATPRPMFNSSTSGKSHRRDI